MSQAIFDHVTASSVTRKVPVLKGGYTVRVHQKIKEGSKERVQIFEGLVIRVSSGAGVNKTFTVRRMVDGIGVEKIFPMFSPNIAQIDIVKRGKVRRAKLYYMRDLTGKSARLRETAVGDIEMQGKDPEPEVEEAPEVAEEPPVKEAPAEKTEEEKSE